VLSKCLKQLIQNKLFHNFFELYQVINHETTHRIANELDLELALFCRDGFVTLQEYMAFMISKETENVQSSEEIEMAFRAITSQVIKQAYTTKCFFTKPPLLFSFNKRKMLEKFMLTQVVTRIFLQRYFGVPTGLTYDDRKYYVCDDFPFLIKLLT